MFSVEKPTLSLLVQLVNKAGPRKIKVFFMIRNFVTTTENVVEMYPYIFNSSCFITDEHKAF